MILKASKTARERAAEILNAAEVERSCAAAELEKINSAIADADKAVKDAITSGASIEEIADAKSKLTAANERKVIFEERQDVLKNKALITADEYESIIAAIIEEADAEAAKAKKDIAKCIEKLAAVGADLCEALTDADAVLGIMQNEVNRNAELRGGNTNNFAWMFNKTVSRGSWGVCEWVQSIIDNPAFRDATERPITGTLNIMEFKK